MITVPDLDSDSSPDNSPRGERSNQHHIPHEFATRTTQLPARFMEQQQQQQEEQGEIITSWDLDVVDYVVAVSKSVRHVKSNKTLILLADSGYRRVPVCITMNLMRTVAIMWFENANYHGQLCFALDMESNENATAIAPRNSHHQHQRQQQQQHHIKLMTISNEYDSACDLDIKHWIKLANSILMRPKVYNSNNNSVQNMLRACCHVALMVGSVYVIGQLSQHPHPNQITSAKNSRAVHISQTEGSAAWVVVMFANKELDCMPSDEDVISLNAYMFCQRSNLWYQCVADPRIDPDNMQSLLFWAPLMVSTPPPRPSGCYAGIGTRQTTPRGRSELAALFNARQ